MNYLKIFAAEHKPRKTRGGCNFYETNFQKNAALGAEMSNFHLPEGVEGGDDEEFCMWWEEPGESFACRDTSKNVYFQFLTGKIYYSVISTLKIWCFPNVVR